MKEYHSIFNHTLAPVTPGPSSSNTCGPVRIGLFCHQIYGGTPETAVIEVSRTGSFPMSLFGMKSDYSFINGLLGRDQNHPEYMSAYESAKAAGMEVRFRMVDDLTIGGYEAARVILKSSGREDMVMIGESLGGGSFRMHSIDGLPIDSSGRGYELFVWFDTAAADEVESAKTDIFDIAGKGSGIELSSENGCTLIHISYLGKITPEKMSAIEALPRVRWARQVVPCVPQVIDPGANPPFDTAAGYIEYCASTGLTPAEAAIQYEMSVSGWNEEQVREYARYLLDIMKDGEKKGLNTEFSFPGIVNQKAPEVKEYMQSGAGPDLGMLDNAIPSALGIMEHSNASGRIVCVPTGGSSGIVPALLLSSARSMQKSERELEDALICAGLVGVLIMIEGNNFSGGMTGCQAEIGCGTAMAAGGLTALMGGSAKEICDAACMGLQSFYGLVCDPVCGFVQVPCLARNMAGVSVAATCAKAVMAGFDVLIPLDEMIVTFIDGGRRIMSMLGHGKAGCPSTPTGMRLKAERQAAGQYAGHPMQKWSE